MSVPAMQAVQKQASDPATNARPATRARSARRPGAIVDSAAIWMPTEAGFANPHSAYVAITLVERG